MRIHHLNCGTMCPWGGGLMDGHGPGPAELVCHVLLVETDAHGLVLVDTGLGLGDVRDHARLGAFFRALNRPSLREGETAVRQVRRLGFDPRDVRHIVLTHLDFDHAGGIEDFPWATVHVMDDELAAATRAAADPEAGFIARNRYRERQWNRGVRWRTYRPDGEGWYGFRAVRDLDGLPPDILLIPLTGHTAGHAGVAVRSGSGWRLHAGDAYFHAAEMDPDRPRCPPGLRAYQTMMEVDRPARLLNQMRLRRLIRSHGDAVAVFSGHDRDELAALRRFGAPPLPAGGAGRRQPASPPSVSPPSVSPPPVNPLPVSPPPVSPPPASAGVRTAP